MYLSLVALLGYSRHLLKWLICHLQSRSLTIRYITVIIRPRAYQCETWNEAHYCL